MGGGRLVVIRHCLREAHCRLWVEVVWSSFLGVGQYFTLPLLVQWIPTDFRRTLPFPMDSADSLSEVHWSLLDMTGFC